MSVEKPVSNLVINELTRTQYNGIDPNSDELYVVVDEDVISIDNSTITENSSNKIQAVGVKDVNTSLATKTWTGTKSEYNSIVSKDPNTLYYITDENDLTFSMLEALYPVGAIYIGTMGTCPLELLGVGTWSLVSSGRVLQGVSTGQTVGSTVEAGLPNITGTAPMNAGWDANLITGAFVAGKRNVFGYTFAGSNNDTNTLFDASRSSSIYGNSTTVQPPAYLVNIWERVS